MKLIMFPIAALFFLFPVLLPAQKAEIEKRLPSEKAPVPMQQFLQEQYPEKRRVKYYEERNESGRFFEAKFCFEKARYSVKFTPEGELVDTERRIPYSNISAAVSGEMEKQFHAQFQRHKVVKVQEMLKNGQVTGYELEIRGKRKGKPGYFECQFDAEGRQKNIRPIEQRPNEFLFF